MSSHQGSINLHFCASRPQAREGILNPLPLEKTFGAGRRLEVQPRGSMGCRSPTRAHPLHIPALTPPAARRLLGTTQRLPATRSRPAAEKLTVCRPLTAGSTAPPAPAAAVRDWGEGTQRWAHGRKGKDSSTSPGMQPGLLRWQGAATWSAESAKVENSKACAGSHVAAGLGLQLCWSGTSQEEARLRGPRGRRRGPGARWDREPTRLSGAGTLLAEDSFEDRRVTLGTDAGFLGGQKKEAVACQNLTKQTGGCGSSREAGKGRRVSALALCRLSPEHGKAARVRGSVPRSSLGLNHPVSCLLRRFDILLGLFRRAIGGCQRNVPVTIEPGVPRGPCIAKASGKPNLRRKSRSGPARLKERPEAPVRRPATEQAPSSCIGGPRGRSPRTNSRHRYPAARLGRRTIAGSEGGGTADPGAFPPARRAPSLRARRGASGKVRAPQASRFCWKF